MTLDGGARVVIQLAPAFAPVHVANIRKFAARRLLAGRGGLSRAGQLCRAMGQSTRAKRALSAGAVAKPPDEYCRSPRGLDGHPARLARSLCARAPASPRLAGRALSPTAAPA